jgi:hypothetical protein
MNEVNWTQLFVEAVMLVGAFLVMYWKQRLAAEHRFTKLETLVSGLSAQHAALETKIGGLDTSIQQLHGRISKVRDKIVPAA